MSTVPSCRCQFSPAKIVNYANLFKTFFDGLNIQLHGNALKLNEVFNNGKTSNVRAEFSTRELC